MPTTATVVPAVHTGGSCADCGHDSGGYMYFRALGFWGRRKELVTVCNLDLHDYGWGDVESCRCENSFHSGPPRE